MKKLIITLVLLPMTFAVMAQADFVPVGGTATGNGGSVTYTIGQIAVQNASNGDKSILEGVQQPYEIQTVGIDDYPGITLVAVVYPNPTAHSVKLKISNYEIPEYGLKAQLYDNNGKILRFFAINDLETIIDMEQYPTAAYQLRVMENNRLLKTFKVVKIK